MVGVRGSGEEERRCRRVKSTRRSRYRTTTLRDGNQESVYGGTRVAFPVQLNRGRARRSSHGVVVQIKHTCNAVCGTADNFVSSVQRTEAFMTSHENQHLLSWEFAKYYFAK